MSRSAIWAVAVLTVATPAANAADAYGAPPPPQYGPPPYATPSPQPPPPPPPIYIYPWYGPYVGANVGFQRTQNVGGSSSSWFAGGIQGGFNWQYGPLVYGVETDFNLSGATDRCADIQFSNPIFGTLRGRGGYTINNIFVYGTAGLAYGINTVSRGGMSESSAQLGWTIGAGVEFGLAPFGFGPTWSAKAEYLYLGLSQGVILPVSEAVDFQSKVLRFGVNYHF
jgi:outer membrane immunogenic protein